MAEKPARLVLLDSHAIIHRAFHAIPNLTTKSGEPTGALYGLTSMLLRVAQDLKPDYLIAARDLPGKTHRHEVFDGYKATRMQAEPELISQLEKAPKVFEAFGIDMYAFPGYEADDMLGTIVHQVSSRSDIHTVIATGDLDTLQLIGPRVEVFTLRKGFTDTVLYDDAAVRARYGFGPEHVVDYKALRGDPSDNIPGIYGIGEKTATELIMQFGSIEDIYRALEDNEAAFAKKVKPRVVELLKGGKADAAFSKELATIHAGAPITFRLPTRRWHLVDHETSILALCDEFEFTSLKSRVRSAASHDPEPDGIESVKKSLENEKPIDPDALRETAVALWLLRSDYTNPGLDEILAYGDTPDFGTAREKIFADLRATGRLSGVYEHIERPLIPIVQKMNATGIALDVPYLKNLAKEYGNELDKIAGRIHKHAGHEFNINSPKQLATILYDELKIGSDKQKKTPTGARTTREDELAKISDAHPIIDDVLSYRELNKLLSTYVEKLPGLVGKDGRLRATFLQTGTTTGRMGCENPNLQNIPIKSEYGRRIREGFIAEQGNVLAALDYSQIELRVAAGLSGDEKLVSTFKHGGDIHSAVAAEVFGVPPEMVDYEMRRRAKVINFGILYGMGANALKQNLGSRVSREEAARFLSDYFRNFAGLSRWIEHVKADALRHGYTETLFGRRRYFPQLKSPLPQMRAQAERMAVNAPIQGTQSDIIKLAMVEADAVIKKQGWEGKAKLLLQVHDELVYEVAEKNAEHIAQTIRGVMESVVPRENLSDVPILAEVAIGKHWGDMQKLKR
ncbi:hypothetical protein HY968_03165 [Candidatus Kaiserbacteria bacterium]|nr:hypothetical protein [Candidatus Kaiserbacteria bacterium]